jgi:hypothetical protein
MPSVVNKIKNAMHGGRDTYEYDDEHDTGRFDTNDTERDRYGGTSSHEPSQVPGSFPNTGYDDPSSHHADGHKYVAPHGTHVGHGHSRREVTDSDQLMDPASQGTGSNVLDDSAAGTTGSHDTQHLGGNKLHRRDDPRGYESGAYSSALPSSGQHQGQGHHLRENIAEPDNRQGYGGETLGSQNQSHKNHRQHGQDHTSNTTTTTTSTHVPHGQHDTRQAFADNNAYNSQQDHQRHNPATSAAATAAGGAALGGLAGSQLTDRSRHHNDSSRHATGTQQQPYDSTGGRINQRDHAAGGGDGRGGGVYNTVVGRGSGDGLHGQHAHIGRGAEDLNSRNYDSHTGILPGQSGGKSSAIPREAGDSRITSGPGTHAFDPSSTQSHNQGPMARDSAAGAIGGGALGSGAGALAGRGSLDPHSNAKVMHKCNSCGHDNDISHYFKKDLIYRVDHQ